jgi:hypothetical protein
MIYQNVGDVLLQFINFFMINYHRKRNEPNLSTKSDDFSKKKEGLGKVMGNGIFLNYFMGLFLKTDYFYVIFLKT